MDKLRACIVANYYANAGMTKNPEVVFDFVLLCISVPCFIVISLHANKNGFLFCLPALHQGWPCHAQPSGHPPLPGVPITFLFPSQPGLWDTVTGSVRVWIPLTARRRIWARHRGIMERRRQQAGAQTRTKYGQSEFRWQGNTSSLAVISICNVKYHLLSSFHFLQDTFGVPSSVGAEQRVTFHTTGDEASRLYAKKTIVVGNVSKWVTNYDVIDLYFF